MYRAGDQVVCVNNGPCRGLPTAWPPLRAGALYDVAEDQTSPDNVRVFLDNGKSYGFYAERFRATPEVPAPAAPVVHAPGQKDDKAKLRVDLIPADALAYVLETIEPDRDARRKVSTDSAIAALVDFTTKCDLEDMALAVARCLHLVDPSGEQVANGAGLEEVARVLEYGAHKAPRPDGSLGYGENNWEGVRPVSRYSAAMLRHLLRLAAGETCDRESKLAHAAHAACCGLFVIAIHLRTSGRPGEEG